MKCTHPRRGTADRGQRGEAARAIAALIPGVPLTGRQLLVCKLSQLSPTTRTPSTAPGTIPQTCAGAFYLIVRRRFPPPWSVEELDACFIVSDSAGPMMSTHSSRAHCEFVQV